MGHSELTLHLSNAFVIHAVVEAVAIVVNGIRAYLRPARWVRDAHCFFAVH
jgi:hypothetical protein